jgi:hypothetical protein
MMICCSLLVLQFQAVSKFSLHAVWLFVLLGAVTTMVSMFLDNVTTVVLIFVTNLICEFEVKPARWRGAAPRYGQRATW